MDNLKFKKILKYDDLKIIKSGNSNEPLVNVKKYDSSIITQYKNMDMQEYTGKEIFVRISVAKKLAIINSFLDDGMKLKITYGYRHPEIQKLYFSMEKDRIFRDNPNISDDILKELTHLLIAVPEVAGHPTGGAVDLTIVDKNDNELNMGTEIADFSEPDKLPTYANGLASEQFNNRKLLHDLMIAENFAPFYGEWWHFSYGDCEWAAFYNHASAIYGEISS